jgi:hypothetical protein
MDQPHGGGAVLLDQVDLDGRAPRGDPEAAVLPAVGEDDTPVGDQLQEPADDGSAVGCTQRSIPPGVGSAVASGPTQRTRPSAVVRCAQTTSTGAAIVTW